jgi:L-threonylcarbamoyladenylate synthase
LIRLAGTPLAAPSANLFGAVSPTTAQHVVDDLGDRLDANLDVILDGGPCPVGVESTIVDCTTNPVQLLRAGAVTAAQIADLLGTPAARASGPSRASGMLASHYAPACEVRLVDSPDDAMALAAGTPGSRTLDFTNDLGRYARDLYSELRQADVDGQFVIASPKPRHRDKSPPEGLLKARPVESIQRGNPRVSNIDQ